MATIEKLDGFEHGRAVAAGNGVADAVSGTLTIVTTPVRTGARALELNPAAGSEQYAYNIAATNRIVTQAVYIRFAALPTADSQLLHFVNANANGYLWFMNTNDKFAVSVGTSGQVEGGPTLVIDTWYRVTVEYDTSTGTYVCRAIVDGGTEFSDSAAFAAADITVVRLGNTTSQTFTAYYDDWLISITDADYEAISTWTSHRIESLIPNADGTHNIATSGDFDSFVGTAFSNSTTNGNTFIGHRPLQAANTADQVIRQDLGATTNYMEFTKENLSLNTDAVDAVRAYATHVEAAASGASLGEARLLLSDATEVLTTGSISVINSTEDPGTTLSVKKRMTIAPSGGWDGTKVDGLKWRIGFADNAPDVNFIDLMVEVAQHVVSAGTNIDGVVLTITPSLPTGSLSTNLIGTVLTVTPSLPVGGVQLNTVTGTVLEITPSLPAGTLQTDLTGTVVTVTPSFPTGSLSTNLTGIVLEITPSLPVGTLRTDVLGTALTVTPTLPTGLVGAPPIDITGIVLTVTPSLPVGALSTSITGTELTVVPSLPTGTLNTSLTGTDLTVVPSLPAGSLATNVTGVVLTIIPTLPTGSLNFPQTVTGIVLTLTPTLPVGLIDFFTEPPLIDPDTAARFNRGPGTQVIIKPYGIRPRRWTGHD